MSAYPSYGNANGGYGASQHFNQNNYYRYANATRSACETLHGS